MVKRVGMNILRIKRIEKISLICGITLILLFILSLYIRAAIPYTLVFTDSLVRFGGTDSWYNMRLVENTLHHFPLRIYFDPFTAYPEGTYNPFGPPLFDLSLAFIVWMIGLGNPSSTLCQHGIDAVGAWYPAVLGALTVFPVYFIGKGLYNRGAGLFSAALIAILPGPFLSRSLLGFTDHHAMETLFSTIAILFFILALRSAREKEITFDSIVRKDWSSLKKPIFYSSFAGLFIGFYFLTWLGAPLFILILVIYVLVQHVTDHLRGKETDYLCIVCMPIFIIPLAMIAPLLSFGFLSKFHVICLSLGICVPLFLTALSFSLKITRIKPYVYPFSILAICLLSFLIFGVFNPSLYSTLIEPLIYIFTPPELYLTIAEVQSMGWRDTWDWFTTTFFIAFAAFILVGYNIMRKWRAEEIFLLIWSVVILFACFGQNRFAAYYAVNVAILCGFLSWSAIVFVAFRGEKIEETGIGMEKAGEESEEEIRRRVKGKRKKKTIKMQKRNEAKAKGIKVEKGKMKKFLRADIIATFIVILFVVFFPPLYEAWTTANLGSRGPRHDWSESLFWMRDNTPDPGVDYYALYPEDYTYPKSAYSVMSWWDNGNWITSIAHRIPVANSFQQGIGGPYRRDSLGACVFFIAKNESRANEVMDAFDVRYVVSAFPMADAMGSYENQYVTMTTWANNTTGHYDEEQNGGGTVFEMGENYFNTMETKLHMFDGIEAQFKEGHVGKTSILLIRSFHTKPLQHYRLVHESSTYMIPHVILNARTDDVQVWDCYVSKNYSKAKRVVHELHRGFIDPNDPNLVRWTPHFVSPVSFVKVFEYVRGARIEGRAPNGFIVGIATNITTNQGREFKYSQIAISNGSYEFVVPYSTEGPIEREGYTNFDVLAAPYVIRTGHKENETIIWDTRKEVEVGEEEVMEGKTVRVDLV